MFFILGMIAGLLLSVLTFSILGFFRAGIEKRVRIVETALGNAGPKPKGAIFMPETDADIARKQIIENNRNLGRDTPIDELI